MKIIFDIYPLTNVHYSGIPQTTWHIAKRLISNKIDCIFTIGYMIVSLENLELLLKLRSGINIHEIFLKNSFLENHKFLSSTDLKDRIYFSPHVMSCISKKNLASVRFIHDISSLTMPYFHPESTIKIDSHNLYKDISLCDHIFTVSNSSKNELIRYLDIDKDKITVVYPGIEWSSEQMEFASKMLFRTPYVVILATKEPRKNLNLIYRYLAKNKIKILNENIKYVFTGPDGWGDISEDNNTTLAINELKTSKKVIFTGFIPEKLKLALLNDALYMIFPSFFEGFGSPVAEALSLGTPVVSSIGGSLSEIGGNAVYYFSPTSLDSLSHAIAQIEMDIFYNKEKIKEDSLSQVKLFTWDNFMNTILDKLDSIYKEKIYAKKSSNNCNR